MELYEEAVREKVCARCIDGDNLGHCRLSGSQECAVKLYFPSIVRAVLAVQGDKMDPYVESLRNSVCSTCRHRSSDGTCQLSQQLDCGLDRYFPLVVEAIEGVKAHLKTLKSA